MSAIGTPWRELQLRELCAQGALALQTGPFGSQLHASDYTPTGTPVVPTEAIGRRRLSTEGIPRVSRETVDRLARHKLRRGDILFARRGVQATGLSALVEGEHDGWLCGTGAILLRITSSEIDPSYLSFVLSADAAIAWLKAHAVGAVMPNLNTEIIGGLQVKLPPIAEQRAIAGILGALDDKIELNRKTNETLEAIAHALFKSWFVDFDPVRAKMERRPPSGMDASTAALFPDSLEDATIGIVPKGWRVEPVQDRVAGVFDGPHATPPDAHDGPLFLGIRNFARTRLDLTDVRHIAEADWPQWTKRVVPRGGDIVFTYEATLGHFAMLPEGLRCCLGRRTALVRPRADAGDGAFLFHWFVAPPFQDFLMRHVNPGSTVDRILLSDFPSYPVLVPPDGLSRRFNDAASAIWRGVHARDRESAGLVALRNVLLPKLVSGELRVRDAARALEAAT